MFKSMSIGKRVNRLVASVVRGTLLLFSVSLFVGCNSSDSVTGYLVDAPISGVDYTCSETTGITGLEGDFTCPKNSAISFKIGKMLLGEVSAMPEDFTVYIQDVANVDRGDIQNPKVVKIARLLQSLDDDNNLNNGIKISSAVSKYFDKESIPEEVKDMSLVDMESLLVGGLGKEMVNEDDAISHLTKEFLKRKIPDALTLDTNEDSAVGAVVGIVPLEIKSDDINLYLEGDGASSFTIDSNGSVAVAEELDYETKSVYELEAVAQSETEETRTKFIIVINNIFDVPPQVSSPSSALSVKEDAKKGTFVGRAAINRGDSSIVSVRLTGENADHFKISNNGDIEVNAELDYETIAAYALTVRATNKAGESEGVLVTINVVNITDADTGTGAARVPVLTEPTSALSVAENATVGTAVGAIGISSTGDANITAFTLSGENSEDFAIDNSGDITVKEALDYETTTTYNLTARATSSAGESEGVSVTINVTNVFDVVPTITPPTSIFSVEENATIGTVVGTLNISDTGDSRLVDGNRLHGENSDDFSFSYSNGNITVAKALHYETTNKYELEAVTANSAGESQRVSVTINVINTPDVPVISLPKSEFVVERGVDNDFVISTIVVEENNDTIEAYIKLGDDWNATAGFNITLDGNITVSSPGDMIYQRVYILALKAVNVAGDSNVLRFEVRATPEFNLLDFKWVHGVGAVGSEMTNRRIRFLRSLNPEPTIATSANGVISNIRVDSNLSTDIVFNYTKNDEDENLTIAGGDIKNKSLDITQGSKIVLKTGQTESYIGRTPSYELDIKDDGYYQAGVANDYVRDDTIDVTTNRAVGLMWQDNEEMATQNTMAWRAATDYCNNLNLGGHDDWRLPSIKELVPLFGLLDRGLVFEQSMNIWSATKSPEDDSKAFSLSRDTVEAYSVNNSYMARCVRADSGF